MAAATYSIAICLVAACIASSFVAISAYIASRKKTLAYLGTFSAIYGVEQALILYNEYLTQNLPFNAEWGAMEDPFSHIVLGAALCQSLWLVILDFTNENRWQWKYGPVLGFTAISLLFYAAPGIDDAMRKWVLYSLRQFFLLGGSIFFWLRYLTVDSAPEKIRYRRKAPYVLVFTVLVVLIFLEDAVVMLLVKEPDLHNIFLTEFLYRRNIFEIALCLCAIGYAIRSALRMLELKRNDAYATTDQHRTREASSYFSHRYGLSSREEEILVLVLDGMDNQRIASHLQVSVGTIKTHTHHIFEKTGTANRGQLIEKFWSES